VRAEFDFFGRACLWKAVVNWDLFRAVIKYTSTRKIRSSFALDGSHSFSAASTDSDERCDCGASEGPECGGTKLGIEANQSFLKCSLHTRGFFSRGREAFLNWCDDTLRF